VGLHVAAGSCTSAVGMTRRWCICQPWPGPPTATSSGRGAADARRCRFQDADEPKRWASAVLVHAAAFARKTKRGEQGKKGNGRTGCLRIVVCTQDYKKQECMC